jgi:uroporphyrinogen decarboxylase
MAAELENNLFLRACFSQKTERTPVWLMRQAGRYLPEYRQTRAKAGSFLDLAKSPEYATEITLESIDRYGLDAAILFFHGISQFTPPENVTVLVDAVKRYSTSFRASAQ